MDRGELTPLVVVPRLRAAGRFQLAGVLGMGFPLAQVKGVPRPMQAGSVQPASLLAALSSRKI